MKPLYQLLKKNTKFLWNEQYEHAFQEVKTIIASDQILMHFDLKLPIVVSTDASQEGIAAALSHRTTDGSLRPVVFISRTLSDAERNYSVLDKEALAVYWATKKLHHYLMGQNFTIQTDDAPLVTIYGENKPVLQMISNRLQRWALFLSGFSYKIEHIKGPNNSVADMLSRHPLPAEAKDEVDEDNVDIHLVVSEGMPIDSNKIAIETRTDPLLINAGVFVHLICLQN